MCAKFALAGSGVPLKCVANIVVMKANTSLKMHMHSNTKILTDLCETRKCVCALEKALKKQPYIQCTCEIK